MTKERRNLEEELARARQRLADAEHALEHSWPAPAPASDDPEVARRHLAWIETRAVELQAMRTLETDVLVAQERLRRLDFLPAPKRGRPRRTDSDVRDEIELALTALGSPLRRPRWIDLANAMAKSARQLRELRKKHPAAFVDTLPPE